MQIVVVFLVMLAGSCGRLAAGLKAGVCWRCVRWRGLAADLECGRDSRTTKTPPFVRLKRDQKQGRNTGRNGRREAGGSGSGLIPHEVPVLFAFGCSCFCSVFGVCRTKPP